MLRRWWWLLVAVAVAWLLWVMPPQLAGTWWSLLPPLLAISLALVFREVLVSLFLGVWLGTTMLAGANPLAGFLRAIDGNVRGALADPDHVSIIIFSMLLGGMVGVMSRAGGMSGVVRLLEPLATTPRRTQLVAWAMGVAIFFDDYSNTLIVGNAMRPVTDRHHISREKLAFIVDSTAAPVACLALVSTWIGYQVSLLADALHGVGSDINPFGLFLESLPYAFYPLFAIVTVLTIALSGRDWGPMAAAERRAAAGELLAVTARPLADYESSGLAPDPDTPPRPLNAVVPVLTVVGVALVGLVATGRQALAAEGVLQPTLRDVIGASDPFTVLLWASLCGLVAAIALAVLERVLDLREALDAAVAGFKSMLMAVLVLALAWSLGKVCVDLATADFLKQAVGEYLHHGLLPSAVFLVAAAVSFATGTSWGTMAILTPLAVPLAFKMAPGDAAVIPATVSAILGGSVFGDHCSPISDTTIMSSMASSCDHVDHVRTQLPYALMVAAFSVLLGYLPVNLGRLPPWPGLIFGLAGIVLVFRFAGRRLTLEDRRALRAAARD